ncbi:MAG: GNAT family N-acetyltransferase [Selenomonadaceae bacterium]|nr:GNAT family N-acetyltransferase [Selenomonadaceae bacterium]
MIEHAIDLARSEGYRSIFLDTHEDLKSARHLYESLGFKKIPPYYFNPLEHVVYYRLDF